MYLDPGFGGMLLQVIVAIAVTGGAILYSLRRKIKALFSKDSNNEPVAKKGTTTDDAIDTLEEDE